VVAWEGRTEGRERGRPLLLAKKTRKIKKKPSTERENVE
jgi:hypothetical protein